MSATIPELVAATPFHERLTSAGLTRIHQGKVRDTYALPDDSLLLVVATDRVSIFDFVLPTLVPRKGELLTALTVFWLDEVLQNTASHLVASGENIDEFLPPSLRDDAALQRRALVVEKLSMTPVECIVRGYLTGSGWKSYQKTQEVCGIQLPPGLHDGSRIVPAPIFTPTTKAEAGHDEHLQTESVTQEYGPSLRYRSLMVYQQIATVAESKRLILADTKFEFGVLGPSDGKSEVLADEVGTPDSSRFWDYEEWQKACEQRTSPPPFDKEIVRQWGKQVATPLTLDGSDMFGLDCLDPEFEEDLAFVHSLTVPEKILQETACRYATVLERLTGCDLQTFHKKRLGVV
jgi:phosphoribosylaminoimidazole-succinocarboxamide synthase